MRASRVCMIHPDTNDVHDLPGRFGVHPGRTLWQQQIDRALIKAVRLVVRSNYVHMILSLGLFITCERV